MQSQIKCAWRWPGILHFFFFEDTVMLLQSCLCYSQRHPSEGADLPARCGGFYSLPLPTLPQFLMWPPSSPFPCTL